MGVSPWMNAFLLFLSTFQGELEGGAFVVSKCHGRRPVGIYYVYKLYKDSNLMIKMKENAVANSKDYSSERAWGIIKVYLIGYINETNISISCGSTSKKFTKESL